VEWDNGNCCRVDNFATKSRELTRLVMPWMLYAALPRHMGGKCMNEYLLTTL